jgi:LytR cell envelope-related transcriptional attenuator
LGDQVKKQGLGNPITDAKLVNAIAPQLTVDQGFSTSHMIAMIGQFQGTDAFKTPQYTLPVMTSTSFSYVYQGYNYGNVTFPVNGEGLATIGAFLNLPPLTNTMTGQPLPSPSATNVSILNQSGISSAGDAASTAMKALGFNVSSVTQGTPPGNPAETVVAYNSLNPDVVAQAQMVLRSMSGQTIMAYEPNLTSPVTLMLGSTYSIYTPEIFLPFTTPTTKANNTTTTMKASSTTTTTAPSTTTTIPGFSAPNSSTTKLEPWDPRSCNKSGGAGP